MPGSVRSQTSVWGTPHEQRPLAEPRAVKDMAGLGLVHLPTASSLSIPSELPLHTAHLGPPGALKNVRVRVLAVRASVSAPGPTLTSSGSAGLEWILRICVFKKLPVNSDEVRDPRSLRVSVTGSQRSQDRPPYKGCRTGRPVCSRPL